MYIINHASAETQTTRINNHGNHNLTASMNRGIDQAIIIKMCYLTEIM